MILKEDNLLPKRQEEFWDGRKKRNWKKSYSKLLFGSSLYLFKSFPCFSGNIYQVAILRKIKGINSCYIGRYGRAVHRLDFTFLDCSYYFLPIVCTDREVAILFP